jgi:transcriptional regulator with XRE-family HTH domain
MWLDNIKELKKKTAMTVKQIADKTNLPERTVARVFSGETDNPYITTLIPIVNALGGNLSEIFADTNAVVGTEKLATLQENVETVNTEKDLLLAENKILQDKVAVLTQENELLKMKLMHKEELLAVHNYYTKIKCE